MKTKTPSRYPFTNQFAYSGLKSRIQMMNQARSDEAGWRYVLLWVAMLVVGMSCQNWQDTNGSETTSQSNFPITNPTRALVDKIETSLLWGRLMTYHPNKVGKAVLEYGEPFIIGLKGPVLTLAEPYKAQTLLYINGKEASVDLLPKLDIDYIEEFFVLHQFESVDNRDPKPYRILMQISENPIVMLPGRQQFVAMLEAAAISDHPLGINRVYTMNKLLEATFFGYKGTFVKRTKNQHLKVQEEYINDISVSINGIPVDPKEVETVHVREIDRLYTRERPFTQWLRTGKRESRYVLEIKTAPKRAKRDSSYYVFSPFYSGDF